MKRKTKDFDWEGSMLALGWDIESTSSGNLRAFKGSQSTEWHSHWSLVHDEVMRMERKEAEETV